MKNRMLVLVISTMGLISCSEQKHTNEILQVKTWNGADTLKIFMDSVDDPNPKIEEYNPGYNNKDTLSKIKHPKFNSKAEEKYILKFYKTAIIEYKKYGIPPSIKLAQGLLESASGKSNLCKKSNNHFGIKWTPNCKLKYVVAKDDSPTDKFRVYKSAWYSYRDHSKFLMMDRYKPCRKCNKDYECWAKQLKKCGYATSKTYTQSLIAIIERNKLYEYDNWN